MGLLFSTIRKTFLWNYARNTWQWDILCVLILVFIFLTPKSWFTNSKREQFAAHPSPTSTLVVGPEVIENIADKQQIEARLRTITGRDRIEVIEVRKVMNSDGRIRGYEVDIR
jgi:hypothetical protein